MLPAEFFPESRTIVLNGKLDSINTYQVADIFAQIDDDVTVDMKDLDFISSSGIGILVMTYRRLADKGKQIQLINLQEHIKKVFEVSLLDTLFKIR